MLIVIDNFTTKEANRKVYIVTDGVDYSFKELYRVIAEGFGKRPLSFFIPMGIAKGFAWAGDIGGHIARKPLPLNSEMLKKLTSSLIFSSQKIQEEIGFKAQYNLYNSIGETIRWYNKSKIK